jgi:asparagine synthase (glutamine-hydrolysing)
MCGICGMLIRENVSAEEMAELKLEFYKSSCKINHRGPDRSVSTVLEHPINVVIDFKRLAIMDPSTKGDQPFKLELDNSRTIYVTCNGEIYKYKDIVASEEFKLSSGSDCEVIPLLYKKYGIAGMSRICQMLNSEHAFSILDVDMLTGDYILILSSDRFGKRPLFIKTDSKGFYYSSELQGLPNIKDPEGIVQRFPPAHYGIIEKKNGKLGGMKLFRYYDVPPSPEEMQPSEVSSIQQNVNKICTDVELAKKGIRDILTDSVVSRLDADRDMGFLLSGGLDSSIICGIAAKHLSQFGKRIKTFSIGIKDTDSIDKPYAEKVSKHIGSEHTFVEFTESEFLNAIPEVVRTTGSFDITTIRASTGQYLISKWIRQNTNIKVLFCGDGSDEILQGYLYSFNGPSVEALHLDSIRLVQNIHFFDGLRADRCVSRWGLELRIPFLDYRFVDWIMRIDPKLRTPMYKNIEKWLLRSAFDTRMNAVSRVGSSDSDTRNDINRIESSVLETRPSQRSGSRVGSLDSERPIIPYEVLYRIKSAFSDSVASKKRSWVDIIKENVETKFSDIDLKYAQSYYKHLSPINKESLYYRKIFCEYFGENISVSQTIPYFWMPQWCDGVNDPSARCLAICKEGTYVNDKTQ